MQGFLKFSLLAALGLIVSSASAPKRPLHSRFRGSLSAKQLSIMDHFLSRRLQTGFGSGYAFGYGNGSNYSGGNFSGGYGGTGGFSGGYGGTGGFSGGYGGTGGFSGGYGGTGGFSGGYGGTGGFSGGYGGTGGFSGGYGGTGGFSGGYGGTGGFSGGYGGYGGFPSNFSFVDCPEQYCYPTYYTATGELDYNKMMQATSNTCATYTEGCPCNDQWEVQCESYGYKMCYPKSEGCYDPFNVTCSENEYKCTDEWSAYCWDKSWGTCPVSCKSDEIYCSSYVYNSQGEVDWDAPMGQTCANATTGCPCDAQWEDKCTDEYGYSWCTPKTYPCPITCAVGEQTCYQVAYLETGEPDWMAAGTQSCAPSNGACPCHPTFEELCNSTWGSYCQSTHGGMTCPIECKDNEHYCYETPYDEFGNIDYYATWKESCAPAAEGCPCNPTWEHKCSYTYSGGYGGTGGYSWCQSKLDACPVDCGDAVSCWHYSGNQSCATATGCTCEADELACPDAAGITECYAKEWYGESCPLTCNYDTQNWCYRVGFDSSGFMTWTEYCYDKSGPDDWFCPVICNTDTAKTCGEGDFAECVPLNEDCPEVCTAEQQMCWVANYDTQGNWLSGSDKCAPMGQDCPCGENTQLCTFDGWSYCEATFYGCPITCAADEKYCYPMSYTAEGLYDFNAPVQETCAKTDATCPCGANAKPCKWTDEWGYEQEWCYPEVDSCPVTCTADQKRCYLTDYNASGYPEKFSEQCVSETRSCPCGTNSQECYDPYWGESYCYPLADFWSNEPMNCPVYCTDEQDYCYLPSYDAKGNWIKMTEECVPKGQACDCSKGQNAFSCTFTDPLWGSWTECLPTHNGFCPSDCPNGEVACDLVEDYMPNGTSLGFVQPSVKCAASYDQCPCGKEASRCPNEGCIFKDEGCAKACGATEKKCYLADYTADGAFISDQEVCVPSGDTCPCGKNTAKCANSDLCLPSAQLADICPCKASEKECRVTDYFSNGTASGFSTQCVTEGTACPCGQNTVACPDPNDALSSLCVASFQHKRCPAPCTADAILAGNQTCVQMNVDSNGNFKSETITCIGANETCGLGEGMKRCPSGAAISTDTTCRTLYASSGARRLSGRQLDGSAQREMCEAVITMSSLRSDAKAQAETVRVKMNSVLQMPNSLKTDLIIKSGTTRRLAAGHWRRLASTTSTMIFIIDNQGIKASVTPAQICEELKKMVKSSSPALTSAVEPAGVINSQAGVNLEISTATIKSRNEAAVAQRNEKAGITTRSTTSTTLAATTTAGGTTAGGTTAGGTTAGGTTAGGTGATSTTQAQVGGDTTSTTAAPLETDSAAGRVVSGAAALVAIFALW